ncbi:perlucin-like [Contarinia nasturtii]|uniref:perlucin-like n=1 Tax=Contarinia nasturtii TaxID=265458 RepID=UPI0012D48E44|nr:perlucin-like [Contarinia nasturtii]
MKLSIISCILLFTLLTPIWGRVREQKIIKKYHLITLAEVNFYKAVGFCRSIGMHLVSISSEEESERLTQQIKIEGLEANDFWTSGSKLAGNGTWEWVGIGKPVIFTNWSTGEPSNPDEQCIIIKGNSGDPNEAQKWNDASCDQKSHFICEKYERK